MSALHRDSRATPFSVRYDPETGTVVSLENAADPYRMNFQNGHTKAGTILYTLTYALNFPPEELHPTPMGMGSRRVAPPLSVKITGDAMEAEYDAGKVRVLVHRAPDGEFFNETYTFYNPASSDVFLQRGELGIFFPLCDRYEDAETCFSSRAHTHLFCGEENTWLCALRMGMQGKSLGMALTEGSIDTYSVERDLSKISNERGDFILHPTAFHLRAGESKTLAFRWFFHDGKEDFLEKLAAMPEMLRVDLPSCVCFPGDTIPMTFSRPTDVELHGKTVAKQVTSFVFRAEEIGEECLRLTYGGRKTFVRLLVSADFDALVERRLERIVAEQQYMGEGPLHGAFLIYDNEEKTVYFDNIFADHNASRERLGMGLLLALWLQKHENPAFRAALDTFVAFVKREFLDASTGEVFNTVGRDPTTKRLYNAPWVASFMTEMYRLTGENEYLEIMLRIMEKYYAGGGAKFYPNGLSVEEQIRALRDAGMTDKADRLLALFRTHVDNMVKNGVCYPKHEVNYEQTIVTPAASFTAQMYRLTGEEKYRTAAEEQIAVLCRFDGFAPDHHLYRLAIRHWDDFWFGKRRLFGDTFPHYWSVLSSVAYLRYAKITGDEEWERQARAGAAGCLSLFTPDGKGSCAYVFPYAINGIRGEFADPFANDQDFALYFYLKYFA